MASWSEFKKRFGTAASRDPAVTIGGMFGTEGARKKQKERLSSRAKIDAELARNKRDRDALNDVSEVTVTAKKKSAPAMDQISMGTASVPKAAKPTPVKPVPDASRTVSTPSPAPKPRNYSTEAADKLKLGEDSAVTKKLRERSKMSQEERNKPFGEDNEVLKKLRAAGYNFAKGGKINGVARKGKTKGRFI